MPSEIKDLIKRIQILELQMQRLLNRVHRITAKHAEGVAATREDLDELLKRRIDVEKAIAPAITLPRYQKET